MADLEDASFEHLMRVGGPEAAAPLAELRIRDRDLVICDGAGMVHYALRFTSATVGWEQRAISFPPLPVQRAMLEHPTWARRARRLCRTSPHARACRVQVGVVAAEARAADELSVLTDAEEAVLNMSEAAGAVVRSAGGDGAKAGRNFLAEVDRARRPSHVPLFRLQRILAEELALGRSVAAICSRAPGFSDSNDVSKVSNLLYRRAGLLGARDCHGRLRYPRVATADTAELLCQALDIAPEQVGL
ncbi:MAG TPA: hypothetical protein VFU11_05245 [Solirubrobacterales bacterium]|nr:hypothetical protein [Solirubrobacterales bacterium]